jgi:hypothetical protein
MNNSPYVNINHANPFYFSSCEGCETPCCDGSRFLFAPMILDDFEEVYKNFPIVFAYIDGQWRILMIIATKENGCAYYIDKKCSIYEQRPPPCKLYPINPYFDDLLVDTSCQAVSSENGSFLASSDQISPHFYHSRIENFNEKRVKTHEYLLTLIGNLSLLGTLKGIAVYRYEGDQEDRFLGMHHASLQKLNGVVFEQ